MGADVALGDRVGSWGKRGRGMHLMCGFNGGGDERGVIKGSGGGVCNKLELY